ncbi:MAG: PAS domain-containing protein [Saprospiraceae bacterium]|nr:PAS domain-containing protein [Saprospiraceae bacterium]
MKLKIKTKLTLGVGLLLLLIVLLSLLGMRYLQLLSGDTEKILEDNYNTLEYARQMLHTLDDIGREDIAITLFEEHLKKQQNNITEIAEKEITESVTQRFEKLRLQPRDTLLPRLIREDLGEIMKLNMYAIARKSNTAKATADSAMLWIGIIGGLCFLIALALLLNLPGNIANPIRELTASIRQIAAKNYSQRVHFENHVEFGQLAKAFNSMAEKLAEYNNSSLSKLLFEKKRIEALINNMHDPVIGLDEKKCILFANQEALQVLGLSQEQLIGRPVQELSITNDLMRSLARDILKARGETDKTETQAMKIFADGKESYFEKEVIDITITPTGEDARQLIGHVIVLKNITAFKELDFAKTNFIATVSHELKTPISSIKLSLQLLESEQTGPLNEAQKQLTDSIREDAGRLLKMTSELLNMTQVESGNIQLSIRPASPEDILQYAIETVKVQAEAKKIRFDLALPKAPCPLVLADNEKTAWVLTNLIANAIRYSYDNSTVYLSIVPEAGKVKFLVRDTGQGIAPEYKDKIFDRYFRIPGSRKEGTGLGLAISKEFIEAQGGEISVTSDFGAGSTFVVVLNAATL